MKKEFNVTAVCLPDRHYMVNIDSRLKEIRQLADAGKYFTVSRARQYGKTTILMGLEQVLKKDYYVIFMDFQTFGNAEFKNENIFALSFADSFLKLLKKTGRLRTKRFRKPWMCLRRILKQEVNILH